MYSCGSNDYGQIGVDIEDDVLYPVKININRNMAEQVIGVKYSKLCVGPYHNFFVDDDGIIYSWGLGSYGQLGNNKLIAKQSIPMAINNTTTFQENNNLNTTVSLLDKHNVKKSLFNMSISLGFDSSFILLSIPSF